MNGARSSGTDTARRNREVLLLALFCLGAVAAGLLGATKVFATFIWLALSVSAFLGLSSERLSGAKALRLGLICVLLATATLTVFPLDDPGGELQLWGGLPRATAVLVYAVWPLGLLLGLFYGLTFESVVLDQERLRQFEQRWSRHRRDG